MNKQIVDHAIISNIYAKDIHSAPIQLGKQAAQQLINNLWNCGLRPSGIKAKDESIGFIQSHLDDMRTIAFHTLNITKEQKP